MTYEEKVKWLEGIFSNDPKVRSLAMGENIPQPLFETVEGFGRALDELPVKQKGGETMNKY